MEKKGPYTKKPSTKYTSIKTSDPFESSKSKKSHFSQMYYDGSIPCRIAHGSVSMKLTWTQDPKSISMNSN